MSFLNAPHERQQEYHMDGLGTKICLRAPNLEGLEKLQAWASRADLPHALITDTGNNTSFGGIPTVSAIGIGPLTADESRELRRLQLLP